jgi:predicted GNAT family acetyltransferase
MEDRNPLDNCVWAALTTAHAPLARGRGLARHYRRDVVPFSAIAEPEERAYADLAESLAPGLEVRLFRPREEPDIPGWETLSVRPIVQMTAERIAPAAQTLAPELALVSLSLADAAEMLALAEATKPGPFAARTALIGEYLGIREARSGRLLAMAGERFRLPGYVELSGICVAPEARGRGFAHILTQRLAARALERGELPFLHVFPDNPAAALYMRWGFRERARPFVIWRRPRAR